MKRLRNFLRRPRGCQHERTSGVANYYDRDLRIYLRLVRCDACGAALIHES